MSPDRRREAIVAAAIPLLRESGVQLSTRQIAEAAGVAEGTLFRVFPDKAALLHATVVAAMEPAPMLDALRSIDPRAELEPLLVEIVTALEASARQTREVVSAARHLLAGPGPAHKDELPRAHHRQLEIFRQESTGMIESLLVPHAAELRWPPARCAALLLPLVFSMNDADLLGGAGPTTEEIVDAFLHGLAIPTPPTDHPGSC